jgi:N utilization substance protein B
MSVTEPISGARKSRRKAREFALRGLYQWKLAGAAAGVIAAQLAEEKDFASVDEEHFAALLQGAIAEAADLDALVSPFVERKLETLSPVEHALLLLGAFELRNHPEIPYRVVINEAVELAKRYGGTDGHKFVNGVLDKLAARLRALEVGKK